MRRVFGRGRYANVTATLALVIALGGTSYAAITLPRNSVGSLQLKKSAVANTDIRPNAVTSGKVKNGTLLSRDFRSGQLPAGPRGFPGAAGAPGAPGVTGATGPSDAFQVRRDDISPPIIPAGATTTVTTLTLQPGKYVLFAKLDMDNPGAPVTVTCRLEAGTSVDEMSVTLGGADGCNLQTAHDLAVAGAATLKITTPAGSSVSGGDAKIAAIRVGSLLSVAETP